MLYMLYIALYRLFSCQVVTVLGRESWRDELELEEDDEEEDKKSIGFQFNTIKGPDAFA